MAAKPRQRYTPEFKAQILEILATGKPVSQVAKEFSLSEHLLYNWRLTAHGPQGGNSEAARAAGEGNDPVAALRALQREIALLRQENDILKKAAVILGTRPQPNSGP
jgi:transposase